MNEFQSKNNVISEGESNFDFKKEFFKYLYYWKFFLVSSILFFVAAITVLRYSTKIYKTTAKIQIIDKKQTSLELPTASELFSNSKINLENEMEVLKSIPILSNVIKNKNLQTSVFEIGNIMKRLTTEYPFKVSVYGPIDTLSGYTFKLNITENGFEIIDVQNESKSYSFNGTSTTNYTHTLPFEIIDFDKNMFIKNEKKGYEIRFSSKSEIISSLKKTIKLAQIGKDSEIIKLDFNSESSKYSEIVLNELIDVYNDDGVKDRQLIHKRTIDFVNERYAYLSAELDSIEIAKQFYKVNNNLVDLISNSAISLEKSFKSEEEIYNIENQISITNLLINSLDNNKLELLPANMVIENEEINTLISNYNQIILERKKLILSAGSSNPSTKQLDYNILDFRSNIINSLQSHLSQLKNIKSKLSDQFYKYNIDISNLPEKEKILRAIERNQKIKESLYLFLLQKREEAEVSFAVTEPSIKVVEHAVSIDTAVAPDRLITFLVAIFLGLILPFISIYLIFTFNRKIYTKDQIEELNLPIDVISEIPQIEDQTNTTLNSAQERSPLAESFRVLYSKLKFYGINEKKDGHIIMITSIIKGEGKTFCATNLAYTMASLGKKVLLIGADLHNPQIHTYLDVEKNKAGLVDYLVDNSFSWKKAIIKKEPFNCDILIGGQIPPNPAQLLNNGNYKKLLDEAKKIYDHIIVDTPPCLLVSDTFTISNYSDLLVFVIRCDHTDIDILDFINDSHSKGVINKNSIIVLNGLGSKGKYGYGYAYNYSYSYKYNYSYNYNYGYGYDYKSNE